MRRWCVFRCAKRIADVRNTSSDVDVRFRMCEKQFGCAKRTCELLCGCAKRRSDVRKTCAIDDVVPCDAGDAR
eukprot:8729324-Pyramimonas_sp.AAC.1